MDDVAVQTGGYDPKYFALLASIEDRHFWFKARRSLIGRLTHQLTSSHGPGFTVLEFGCGGGNVLSSLKNACPHGFVIGMDLFFEGLSFARTRGNTALVQADAMLPPFHAASFCLVGAFDVIEHLPNDQEILRNLKALLLPNGHLIVTVPANPWLWSRFDDLSHHCRRYTKAELLSKLESAGFEVRFLSPYMATILPLVWLHRILATRVVGRHTTKHRSDAVESELRIVPLLNGILTRILQFETLIVSWGLRLPFGTSLVAIARNSAEANRKH